MKSKPHVILIFAMLSASNVTHAALDPPDGPSNSTDGNFTLTYPWDDADAGCEWVVLQESVNSGANWTNVPDHDYDGSVTFTTHPPGQYVYRSLAECEDYYGEYSWEEYSNEFSVTVGAAPVTASLAEQAEYIFETRVGDINFDGRQDIYIERTVGGSANSGVLLETILIQAADKTFTVLSAATTSQKSTASGWPIVQIEQITADYNVDGFIDIFLKNLGNHISGANDQLVFSYGVPYGNMAEASTDIDTRFRMFVDNTYSWILDHDYYDAYYTPGYYETGYGYECQYVYNWDLYWNSNLGQDLWWDIECSGDDYDYWVPGEYDTSYVDLKAIEASAILDDLWRGVSIDPGAPELIVLRDILEELFEVPIFGGVFGQGTGVYTDVDDISRNERLVVGYMLAAVTQAVSSPPAASSVFLHDPLPGSSINKKNYTPGKCTSDGRYDDTGVLRGGPKHWGVDLGSGSSNVIVGTSVFAVADGNIIYANQISGAGQFLEMYHSYGFISRYMHLSTTITTTRKNRVSGGDVIGEVGRSGNVNSCAKTHLHFAAKAANGVPFDPTPIFNWPLEP